MRVPVPAAGLRGVGRIDLHQLTRLVGQLAFQAAPAARQDFPVQSGLLCDLLAGFLNRPFGRGRHALGVQVLHDDRVGRVRQLATGLVGGVVAFAGALPVAFLQPAVDATTPVRLALAARPGGPTLLATEFALQAL